MYILTLLVLFYYMYILRPTKYNIQRILYDEAMGDEENQNEDIEINTLDENRVEESGITVTEFTRASAGEAHFREEPRPPYTDEESKKRDGKESLCLSLNESGASRSVDTEHHDERQPLFHSP